MYFIRPVNRQSANVHIYLHFQNKLEGFPDDPVVQNLPANEGDMDLIPGLGRVHRPQSN